MPNPAIPDRYGPADLYPEFNFANEIIPQPLQWLWPNRIPLAKLTLLIGDPGVGKSLLATDLAARVSTGAPWPDNLDPEPRTLNPSLGGVIFHAPEDDPAETLIPRLKAAGANLDAVCILKGVTPYYNPTNRPTVSDLREAESPAAARPRPPLASALLLPAHTPVLEQAVRVVNCPSLLILDPLHAMLEPAAQSGSHALAQTLADLAETAREYNIAILAVCHLTKAHTRRILYRVRGSLSLIAAARAVHVLTHHPDRPDRRILTPIKTIDAPSPPPLEFNITSAPLPPRQSEPETQPSAADPIPNPQSTIRNPQFPPAPRLDWQNPGPANCGTGESPVQNLPLDLLDTAPDAHSAIIEAADFLQHALAQGPRPAAEILRQARSLGHSLTTLRRAKRILAVYSLKPTVNNPWLWSLQRPDNEGTT